MLSPDVAPTPSDLTPLQAALLYAELGLCVLPITPGKKHPPIPGWQDAATTDPVTIESWWTGLYRGHGVGIATGARSGVWALDIDVSDGKQGRDSLLQLETDYGKLPFTVAAATGTGGRHVLFAWDPARPVTNGMAANLPPGLDIRGEGGQIVVAPTIHPNGQPYEWMHLRAPWAASFAPGPEWLFGLLLPRDLPPSPCPPPPLPAARREDTPADIVRNTYNWRDELLRDGWTEMHARGNDTYWCRPGKNPRDGHSAVLHDDGAFVIFTTDVPPGLANVGKPTANGEARTVSLFDYVAAYRHNGDRRELARDIRRSQPPSGIQTLGGGTRSLITAASPSEDEGGADEEDEVEDPNRHRRRILTESDLSNIQPPEPLAEGWFNRNSLAVIFGPAKKGKTFVAIDLSMSIATGRGEWMCGPVESGQVVYCLGEGISGLNRRVQAWRAHYGVTDPARLAILPHVPQLHNGVDVADFIDAVDGYCPDLIVIDTLARATVGVEENSSKDMGEVIHQLDRIKEATGACVLVLHHTGKDASRGTRGSSALTGAIDTGVEVRGDTVAMTLVVTQQKDGDVAEPCQFRAEAVGESIVMVPTLDLSRASSSTIAVMEALVEIDTGGTSTTVWKDMAAERGVPERTFFRAVKWLVDNREVKNVGSVKRPVYTVYTIDAEGDD